MNTGRRILSITAFGLLLAAIVLPVVALGWPRFRTDPVLILAMMATVLALVCGFLGRNFLLGRIAWVGALVVCIFGVINYMRFRSARDETRARVEQAMRQTR